MRTLISAYHAADLLRVSPRTVYRWVELGWITPISPNRPLRFRMGHIRRYRTWRLQQQARSRGAFYREIMAISGRSYDTARIWVRRRRAAGFTRNQIMREANKKALI